jgi:hypothetical protein
LHDVARRHQLDKRAFAHGEPTIEMLDQQACSGSRAGVDTKPGFARIGT